MAQAKTVSDLGLTAQGSRNPLIYGLAVDSREVKEGFLFAALPGTQVHGATFIESVLAQGAVAILTDAEGAEIASEHLASSQAAVIICEDPRQALAYTSAIWFEHQPPVMAAVTGTNGKTSVSTFLRMIWQAMELPAVNLGTTGVEGDYEAPLRHTTPEPITLHRTLAAARDAGIQYASMEASSHGLAQARLDGVQLTAAGFTNFTQDHLDYHETFDDYFSAKAALFDRVLPDEGTAVVHINDPRGPDMAAIAQKRGQKVITVGREGADLCLLGQRLDDTGQELRVEYGGQIFQIRLNLIGGFQAENVLVAAGLAIACGAEPARVFEVLHTLTTVRGRMELAATRKNGAPVFVDYAHTPDAVKTALLAMRPHVMGRLIVVVGAGGDRDAGKRPLMGQAAAENADVVVVTDDNPRSEEPALIRAAVKEGAPEALEFGDRAEAILRAVDMLGAGDALLIAGKGHETGQIVGDDVLPFDDVEQASMAVSVLDGGLT